MATQARKPKLLFCSIAAGGGHVATARALAQAVDHACPGRFDSELLDYMNEVGFTEFDRRHKAMWQRALSFPAAARLGQRFIDTFPKMTVALQRQSLTHFARLAAQDLRQRCPDLVIANHGLLTTGLALAKRRYGVKTPVLTFATETHNISAYWAEPWVDHMLVPNEEVFATLKRMGVPAEKLEIAGYPVGQAFLHAPSQQAARERLGLAERLTVLVSVGGDGVGGQPEQLVGALLRSDLAPFIIVICGRNAALKKTLESLESPNVRVEGFVDTMATFLAASDVMVGKGGPATVYEALAVGRPVLATSYAGLNEVGLVRFLEREGLGAYVASPEALLVKLESFTKPETLKAFAERCQTLDLPGQTERLAKRIVSYAEEHAEEAA